MRPQARDTDLKTDAIMMEHYRQMSMAEKWKALFESIDSVREAQKMEIRRSHPNADEREVQLRMASRWCDAELLKKAFGWDVKVEGY